MNASLPSSAIATRPSALDTLVAQFLSQSLSAPEAALLRLRFSLDGAPCSLAAAAQRQEGSAMRALRRDAVARPEGAPDT